MSIASQTNTRPSWVDRIAEAKPLAILAVVLVGLCFFLPGFFSIPPVDRDEARFAQASRQMAASGDYVDIRLGEEPRYKKPVGIYWLQTLAVKASGYGTRAPIWVYRLPSLVGALLALLLVWRIGGELFGPRAGLIAALMFAAIPLINFEARLAKTDAMLLATILWAMLHLSRAWIGEGRPTNTDRLGFALAVSAATLLKGPVVFLVVGATVLSLSWVRRSFAWARALLSWWSVLAFLALTLPWFLAIVLKTDGAFLSESLGKDLLAKTATAKENHGAPPLTYLVSAIGTLWPLSAIVGIAAVVSRRERARPAILFCVAWLLSTWIVLEIIPTKLPHYILPLAPAAALLVGHALAVYKPDGEAGKWGRRFLFLVAFVPALLFAGQLTLTGVLLGHPLVPGAVLLLAATLVGFWTWIGDRRAMRPGPIVAGTLLSAFLANAGLFGLTLPELKPLWISGRVAAIVASDDACPTSRVVAVGYHEPSLRLSLNRPLDLARVGEIASEFEKSGCRHLVVTGARRAASLSELAPVGVTPRLVGRADGVKINGGGPVELWIYGHDR